METCKVAKDFTKRKFSDAELSRMAAHVVEKMQNNPHFPDPQPALSLIASTNASYRGALSKQGNGSKMDTVIKQNFRTEVEDLLRQLAGYVEQTSNGEADVVLSSGFDIHKKKASVGQLAKASGLSIKPGSNRGSLMVMCDVVDRARFYEFQYTAAPATPDSQWMKETSTKRKLLIEGLTSGTEYVFRVAGAGSDQGRCWSDELSSYVL